VAINYILRIALTASLIFSIHIDGLSTKSKINEFLAWSTFTISTIELIALFNICPYLYERNSDKGIEDQLKILQHRITSWEILLENPNKKQLNNFRVELLEYYSKILENRGFFSKLFERGAPAQPWALLNQEILQYQALLKSSKLNYQSHVCPKDNSCLDSQAIHDLMVKLESFLVLIQKSINCRTSFQNECSQARQEEQNAKTLHFISALFNFYLAHKFLENMVKYA